MVAIMYVEHLKSKHGNKIYQQILLRETYREPGAPRSKVKHRTLLNLSKCNPDDVSAIEFALKNKKKIVELEKIAPQKVKRKQGKSAGAVWLLSQLAHRLGLVAALGRSRPARRALWLVIARVVDQGSRLSAVRLAGEHLACETLGLNDFCEDDLYGALDWIDRRQSRIEKTLFKTKYQDQPPSLFLYDVTSSYLEGDCNEYGAYGHPRDGKRGKKQIVVGLLTDPEGVPIAVRTFEGNTVDTKTVSEQIKIMSAKFGVKNVTLVGDRGMIKQPQIDDLPQGFNYITAIGKPSIRKMLADGQLQMSLFDEKVCEVEHDDVRYILRRNPVRRDEMTINRRERIWKVFEMAVEKCEYLAESKRRKPEVALRKVTEKINSLKLKKVLTVTLDDTDGRILRLDFNAVALRDAELLDGCYVIKTDLTVEAADTQTVHDRYKDLAKVEKAFRTMKTGHLEVRPIYVTTAAHTRAHVFIVMLAYLLRQYLETAWRHLDLMVEEGIKQLSTLCVTEVEVANQGVYLEVAEPRDSVAELLAACEISMPDMLPHSSAKVATKRKLPSRRK